jgi:hypothetical protein
MVAAQFLYVCTCLHTSVDVAADLVYHAHFICLAGFIYFNCVSCHYGTARPQVADAEYGLRIWKAATNVSNN